VALLGGNGAGKSTTLKSVSTLLAAERGAVTKGSIEFRGRRTDGAYSRPIKGAELQAALDRVYAYFPRLKMTAIGRAMMAKPSMLLRRAVDGFGTPNPGRNL
jgi:branched-chain amino acid transport system ATP-binding protein